MQVCTIWLKETESGLTASLYFDKVHPCNHPLGQSGKRLQLGNSPKLLLQLATPKLCRTSYATL